jgi:hypothetical protein
LYWTGVRITRLTGALAFILQASSFILSEKTRAKGKGQRDLGTILSPCPFGSRMDEA